jgi:hypothetical protein
VRWVGALIERVRAHAMELGFLAASLVVLLTTALLGVVNLDEGWYAVSARLAARGAVPYRDFAFTQGPLLLYALAPSQLIAPGLLSARLTSVVLSAFGLALLAICVRRLAGTGAVMVFAVLLVATFPELSYWLAITKTVALTGACFALALFAVTSTTHRSIWWPIATAAALGVALTRTAGIAFAVLVVAYCLFTAGDRITRVRVTAIVFFIAAAVGTLGAVSFSRVRWDLYSYHQLAWKGASDRTATIVLRPLKYVRAWPIYSLVGLLALLAIVLDRRVRAWLRAQSALIVVGLGLMSFFLLSTLGGAFFPAEYAAAALPASLALCVIILSRVALPAWAAPRLRVAALLVALALGLTSLLRTDLLGPPGWEGAPAATRDITRCVNNASHPSDQVLALALEEVVVATYRKPVPGATLGIFSYQDVGNERASELHLLNAARLLDALRRRQPSVVVMTDIDQSVLTRAGFFSTTPISREPINAAIDAGYRPVCKGNLIRQTPNRSVAVTVYARR